MHSTDNHIEIKYGDDVVLLLYCRENIFDVHIQTKYFYMTSFSSWCINNNVIRLYKTLWGKTQFIFDAKTFFLIFSFLN
jgi:hypothetical protein